MENSVDPDKTSLSGCTLFDHAYFWAIWYSTIMRNELCPDKCKETRKIEKVRGAVGEKIAANEVEFILFSGYHSQCIENWK